MGKRSKLDFERTSTDLFLKLDGIVIAKRGQPGSAHAKSWIPLEPGYEVIDAQDGDILVRCSAVRVH